MQKTADAEFAIGTIVQLKSGGPKMTISEYPDLLDTHDSCVYCQWFAGSKLESGRFEIETLTHFQGEGKKGV